MNTLRKAIFKSILVWRNFNKLSTIKDFYEDIHQSRYYKPIVKVQDFFTRLNIQFRNGKDVLRIKQCPFCTKHHYNDSTNLFTLQVNTEKGYWKCFRCSSQGSWSQIQAKYLDIDKSQVKTFMDQSASTGIQRQIQQLSISDTQYFFYVSNLKNEKFSDVLQYAKSRGFTQQTLEKYNVGAGIQTFISDSGKSVQVRVLYFPMYQLLNKKKVGSEGPQTQNTNQSNQNQKIEVKLSKIKVRGASKQNKKYTRQFPPGPFSGFFGLNTISHNDKVIVLTQGQFDAMAVYQQTGYPAISLPQGANNLPDSLLPHLNQFQKILLWMDNDQAGKLGQDKISYKLGQSRTYIIKHDHKDLKDANDFLKHAPQKMKTILEQSKTIAGQNILTFDDLKQSVRNRIFKFQEFVGVQISWLPFFNKKVKGVRMQEVSVVSGPTGCGKTTFLSQLSLDLCKKDIPVLWGSFQIRNQVLITNMLMQYSGVNLFKNKSLFDHYAQQFKSLPLYWLSFHGSNDVQKVLSTIQYAIQKHNVSFVVLDTLQFLLADQAEGIKKFDLQDKVMGRLRRIATDYKVHIVIVIHPRKTQQNQDIQIHSIYGSSKAGQQADNIWMIQKRDNFRIFDIKKNRFDGDLGKAAIGYDKSTKSFLQLTRSELSSLYNNEATIEQIVDKRVQATKQSQSKGQQNKQFSLQVQNQANFIYEDMIDNSMSKKKKKNNSYPKQN